MEMKSSGTPRKARKLDLLTDGERQFLAWYHREQAFVPTGLRYADGNLVNGIDDLIARENAENLAASIARSMLANYDAFVLAVQHARDDHPDADLSREDLLGQPEISALHARGLRFSRTLDATLAPYA